MKKIKESPELIQVFCSKAKRRIHEYIRAKEEKKLEEARKMSPELTNLIQGFSPKIGLPRSPQLPPFSSSFKTRRLLRARNNVTSLSPGFSSSQRYNDSKRLNSVKFATNVGSPTHNR